MLKIQGKINIAVEKKISFLIEDVLWLEKSYNLECFSKLSLFSQNPTRNASCANLLTHPLVYGDSLHRGNI